MLLVVSVTSFNQQKKSSGNLTKQDYLKKSKTQKTVAWILVGSGAGLVVIAIATTSTTDVWRAVFGDNSGLSSGATLFAIGGVITLSSIPLFIVSAKNKRKGMSLSFKNETVPQFLKSSFVNRSAPSLSLKISL